MAGGGEGGGALERRKAARSVREGGRRERPALLSNSEKWTALRGCRFRSPVRNCLDHSLSWSCVYRCTWTPEVTVGVFLYCSPPCFLSQGLSLHLQLPIQSDWLVVAPGTPSLPPQSWTCRGHTGCHTRFSVHSREA